jgi:hypothetical protein
MKKLILTADTSPWRGLMRGLLVWLVMFAGLAMLLGGCSYNAQTGFRWTMACGMAVCRDIGGHPISPPSEADALVNGINPYLPR